jgi:hypothetical protein
MSLKKGHAFEKKLVLLAFDLMNPLSGSREIRRAGPGAEKSENAAKSGK